MYVGLMKKSLREQVLSEIDVFMRKTGISKTRFGAESVGNDKIVDKMRAGVNPRIDTIDAMRDYMREHMEAKKKARAELKAQRSAQAA